MGHTQGSTAVHVLKVNGMRRVLLVQPSSWRINTATTNYSCREKWLSSELWRTDLWGWNSNFLREKLQPLLPEKGVNSSSKTWPDSSSQVSMILILKRQDLTQDFFSTPLFRHEDTLCRWCQNVAARNFLLLIIARQNSCWFVRKTWKAEMWPMGKMRYLQACLFRSPNF